MQELRPFFAEKHFVESVGEGVYESLQLGGQISAAVGEQIHWDDADIVIVGCGECRNEPAPNDYESAPDAIRRELYQLYHWHPTTKIFDAGNIAFGATIDDTRAALRTVLHELQLAGKIVIVLGGSHDLTLQQYEAFKLSKQMINAAVTDMLIDLDEAEQITSKSFLMNMLTSQPNFVRHYSHIGFQSYNVHPHMLETLDKLRFDFYRLGRIRQNMEEAEPVLRNSHLFSFDMNAIRFSDAPANRNGSPNGFEGDEACTLTKYAGMSPQLTSFGIYGYAPNRDVHKMTAKQIAQMIWYFIEGYQVRKNEAPISQREEFNEFHVKFTSNDTTFLKSKRSGRWWMQLPDNSFVPCSYSDYMQACNDEIPERWLREQERLL